MTLIKMDGVSVSNAQMIRYLRDAGQLNTLVSIAVQGRIFDMARNSFKVGHISETQIEDAIVRFRMDNRLTDPDVFALYLKDMGHTSETFRLKAERDLQVDAIRKILAERDLAAWFEENKSTMSAVVVGRIAVTSKNRADEVVQLLREKRASFSDLARRFSVLEDASIGGEMGVRGLSSFSEPLQSALANSRIHEPIGPVVDGTLFTIWMVFEHVKATLDDERVRAAATEALFRNWVIENGERFKVEICEEGA